MAVMSMTEGGRTGDGEREPKGFDPANPDSSASANQLEVSRVYVELESRGYSEAAERLRFCDRPSRRMLLARSLASEYLENDDGDRE